MNSEHELPKDPLHLNAADQEIRINELTEKAKELGMGDSNISEGCPADVHEKFLQRIIDIESAPDGTRFNQLLEAGVELPEPSSLDDGALHSKLWEVINTLVRLDVDITNTDHLSDRQLYELLWSDLLRQETMIPPPGSGWLFHIDTIGSGSDEDIDTHLRYYSSEEDRKRWAEDFPDMIIPPHEDPPYDRDRHLPVCEDVEFETDE
jgi:hypothetical protein